MENELTLAGTVAAVVWFINILTVGVFTVGSVLLNFWIRDKRFDAGNTFQRFKWGKLPSWGYSGDGIDWLMLFFVCEVLLGVVVVRVVDVLAVNGAFYPVLLIVVLTLLIIFAPRFIIDICRGLKFNNKTGDLDKIESLQKQIDELKGVDKNS